MTRVFGDTNIEIVSRLILIFGRFGKHTLYLKASKCFFGKVVLDKGLQISHTKIQSILDFPLPTVSKQRTISEILLETIQLSPSHCTSF